MAVSYQGKLLPKTPSKPDWLDAARDHRAIIISTLQLIADRYERNINYPWIDTKLNVVTGEDFLQEDYIRGPNAIYGWIQGRGLEALATQVQWLNRNCGGQRDRELCERIHRIIHEVSDSLRTTRKRNRGHLFFWMTPDGKPFRLDSLGKPETFDIVDTEIYNLSDLFCAKGLYAAAQFWGDQDAIDESREYCLYVSRAIWEGKFRTDQQQLDRSKPVLQIPGHYSHGPYMTQIAAAAMLAEYDHDATSVEMGLRLIEHVLDHHVNLKRRWHNLQEYDFVEYIDDRGQCFEYSGQILSDPGHALEFVGLALKFTTIVKALNCISDQQRYRIRNIEAVMPSVLQQNLRNGFQPETEGICKLFDLVSRKKVNSDMPWWSLPETMRAALETSQILAKEAELMECIDIFRKCHNAFAKHYVRKDLHLLAYQTRSANGSVVEIIPATPDIDPGYHTGLSLLDCLNIIEKKICAD